jgi:hypothetical protein
MEEDRLLCETWLQIGMDPVVGTDQSRHTYWVRMKYYFYAHNPSVNERTDRSLRSWWRIINTDCQKWAGALETVDTFNPSGTGEVDGVSCFIMCYYLDLLMHMFVVIYDDSFFSYVHNVDDHCSKFVQR